ncbi:MAG: amylo-alpha-1,6-glucosidase [Candidatus Woesearchaeota archaeon]
MYVFYRDGQLFLSKQTDASHVFDMNQQGDFLFFGAYTTSKYNGLFMKEGQEYYKLIHSLGLTALPYGTLLTKTGYKRLYNQSALTPQEYVSLLSLPQEEFALTLPGLIYRVRNFTGFCRLVLDMRKMDDFHDQGRFYTIEREGNFLLITYNKYQTGTQNPSQKQYELYLAIYHPGASALLEQWKEVHYPYDSKRKDTPTSSWVYEACNLQIDGSADLVFAYGLSKAIAKERASHLVHQFYNLLSEKKETLRQFTHSATEQALAYRGGHHVGISTAPGVSDAKPTQPSTLLRTPKKNQEDERELLVAYQQAKRSLYMLMTPEGVYAGLPWFTQIWTRDEAIACGALIKEKKELQFVKHRLMSLVNILQPDGRIPNRNPPTSLGSADAVGWVFLRLHQLITADQDEALFTEEELAWIAIRLDHALLQSTAHYGNHLLIKNNPLETWMDTGSFTDVREGYRIEIQALQLAMYDVAIRLGKQLGRKTLDYEEQYASLRKNIRDLFFHGNLLADGKNDTTIRPNLFLAYYIHKPLLSPKEWEAVFDRALPALWCEWGGLRTIDKASPYYCPEHTGADNQSYHRGDSWYYLNHLAACCMLDLNKKKYKQYWKAILHASTQEILTSGALGSCSEISAASQRSSYGCWNQAWSNATFIELVNEYLNNTET